MYGSTDRDNKVMSLITVYGRNWNSKTEVAEPYHPVRTYGDTPVLDINIFLNSKAMIYLRNVASVARSPRQTF